jgi:hypothetical protein
MHVPQSAKRFSNQGLLRFMNGNRTMRGTTYGRRIWSRYFCPVKVPSRRYKSSVQFREEQPQTVTPLPPNAVVPTICSCWNAVFLGLNTRTRRPSTGFSKKHCLGLFFSKLYAWLVSPWWDFNRTKVPWSDPAPISCALFWWSSISNSTNSNGWQC